jgi:hypothetical protein
MTTKELLAKEIEDAPELVLQEVLDFVRFLKEKRQSVAAEGLEIAEAGFADYLANLEDYEDRLARGEIRW